MIDRIKFYADVRHSVFHNHMKQSQVDGINNILDAWEQSGFTDIRWLAYMLGTTFHETAGTMQPIHEYGGPAYFTKMYGPEGANPNRAKSMGNIHEGDGPKYCGRGYVQLTWYTNYNKMGKALMIDLVNQPDLAMKPEIAVRIMFVGMTSPDLTMTFSGVNLQRYFNGDKEDWVGARQIINGTDHADMIAETAQTFNDAL